MTMDYLQSYFDYLCALSRDFLSADERQWLWRERRTVATILASPEEYGVSP